MVNYSGFSSFLLKDNIILSKAHISSDHLLSVTASWLRTDLQESCPKPQAVIWRMCHEITGHLQVCSQGSKDPEGKVGKHKDQANHLCSLPHVHSMGVTQ